ncbi:MAG: Trk system potassium transporter TrkA [Bacillota bacterium]
MRIIIVGGGGVGSALARLLSGENQDVFVIEKNPELVRNINEEIDVIVNYGNGASVIALEKAGIKNAEMLIAVTEVDEVNIVACMLAKKFNVPITVARVRNPEYYEGSSILTNEQLGVDIFINPERVAAYEIAKIIRTPNVGEVEYFAKGQIKMVSFTVDENAKLVNQPLHKLPLPKECIVAAIERKNGEFIVPGGNDLILPEDNVFILGKRWVLNDISWILQKKDSSTLQVVILGGGRIGFQVASMLESNRKNSCNVKLIEKDVDCCEEIASQLHKTLILQGDATDLSFLEQEEINDADVLVAVTGDDRTNILASVLAMQFGVKKTICEVINQEYISLFHTIGINHIISPRLLTAAQILKLIRKGEVISMSLIKDGKMEIVELNVPPDARVLNKKLQHAGIPKGILIGAILRKGSIIMPRGDDTILAGDHLILFTNPQMNNHLDRLFSGGGNNLLLKKNNSLFMQ